MTWSRCLLIIPGIEGENMSRLQIFRVNSIVCIVYPVVFLMIGFPRTIGIADASPVPGVLNETPADVDITLIPSRSLDTIRGDRKATEEAKNEAKSDRTAAEEYLEEAKARIEVCKSEIDMIEAKVELAKEQEDETEKTHLETQVKIKKLQLKSLEARKKMREAERDFADTRRRAAEVLDEFLKKEIRLSEKRDDLITLSTSNERQADPDVIERLRTEIRDLEHQCLEILKDALNKQKDKANEEKDVVEKRLKLFEAQHAFMLGSM